MRGIIVLFAFITMTLTGYAESLCLLSYPRSGSAWMMYTIQYLTKQDWHDGNKIFIFPPIKHIVDHKLPIHYRSHEPFMVHSKRSKTVMQKNCNHETDRLIVIVRNYRECMLRHLEGSGRKVCQFLKNKHPKLDDYFKILDSYELWNPEKRLLIYYEDLMQNPAQEFSKIAQFISADLERLNDFFKDFELHKKQSFSVKRQATPSKGTNINYHSKKLSSINIKAIDDLVKTQYPHHWDHYLSRYAMESVL